VGVGFIHGGLLISLRNDPGRKDGVFAVGTSGDSILLLYHRRGSAAAWAALVPVLDSLYATQDSAAVAEGLALNDEFQNEYIAYETYTRVPCSFSIS
jgi:hypothetical protein